MARSSLALVAAGALLVAGGGGYALFGVYLPGQARAEIRRGVEDWQARWDAARGCLLGAEPASSRTSEAVMVRELAPDPWSSGSCTEQVGRLARGDVADTGEADVEAAWEALDRAAGAAAAAFGTHVTLREGQDDPLPAALDLLEDAAAALRRTAGLPPAARAAGPALPAAQVLPLALRGDPVVALEGNLVPSGGGLVAYGTTRGKLGVEVVLRAGQAPEVHAVHSGVVRSGAAPGWGAVAGPAGVEVGPVDDAGAVRAAQTIALPGAVLLGVVGEGDAGTVIYGAGRDLRLARGAATTFEPGVDGVAAVVEPAAAALTWRKGPVRYALPVRTGEALAAPVALPGEPGEDGAVVACLAGATLWVDRGRGPLVAVAGGAAREVPVDGLEADDVTALVGCTPRAAIVEAPDAGGTSHVVCTDGCAIAPGAPPPREAKGALHATTVDGALTTVVARGNVLAVWSAARGARFVGAGAAVRPLRALGDDRVVDLLAARGGELVVLRLP